MNLRPAFIGLFFALALGSFWYFYEYKGGPEREKSKESAKLVFPELKGQEIVELSALIKDKQGYTVRKNGEAWNLSDPIEAAGDKSQISQSASEIQDLKNEGVAIEKDADLKQFGLDPFYGSAAFKASSGAAGTLILGSDTPDGQYAYAMVSGKAAVFMVRNFSKARILKDLKAVRDKTVWSFSPSEVQKIDTSIGKGLKLEKDAQGAWALVWPLKVKTRKTAVEDWLTQINQLQIDGFVDETGKDLKKYGLGTPATKRLVLTLKGNAKPLVLIQGSKAVLEGGGQGRYYRVQDRPLIFSMQEYRERMIEKKTEDLVEKKEATPVPAAKAVKKTAKP